MVDIDERVVQMKFDNTDFEQKTKKTFSILDKLHEKLSFKDVVDNDAMNSIADNVQKVADKAYTIIDRTIDKIKDNIANKLVGYIHDATIGQVQMGFNKYSDMTTSVATLKAQGYAMEEINEQLERLMYFTDETSYKFTDMVGEIGKFTASGQKLEDATTAMMGIADWAALSGKNANDASRAMYQLSQALGAGRVRKEDYKSIQNLNMDTKEFRQNAIEAAIAIGTLKDNLNGSYTTLVGKKANKLSFTINEFADKLTEGEWFTADVMMQVFSKYSEAVDDIRSVYLEEQENDPNYTTADAIEKVQRRNLELIERFKDTTLDDKAINTILKRWKQVAKATDEVNENYEEMTDEAKEQAMSALTQDYTQYLQEYADIFGGTVEQAEAALDDWRDYVSDFGIKAFLSAQEAKTFLEAIESAKDAASTVWTHIFTTIFGDYNEAKEIWTDLANALYDVFVGRLWALADIFDYWKTGKKEEFEQELKDLQAELAVAELMGDTSEIERLNEEIKKVSKSIDDELWNGRRLLMQGVEAFGGGLKSIVENFRKAWDSLFEENESANKLFAWTERFRIIAFKFYYFMHELGETNFYKNIAQGIMNILSPIKMVINVVKAAIYQFIPEGTTFKDILVKISEGFANMTSKLVPSQETILNLFKTIRGIIAVIKLIGKAVIGVYNAFIRPILSAIWELISGVASGLLETFAEVGDAIYELEEGLDIMDAMVYVGDLLKDVFGKVFEVIGTGVGYLIRGLAPILGFIFSLVEDIVAKVKEFVSGSNTKGIKKVGDAFGDMSKRVKEAWKNSFSLKDVWESYKGGSGLSNFLLMLGDMFDVIVTKIGVTIGAIFGLEETAAEGKTATALGKLKDIVSKTFEIIGWLYTNVLRPVLGTVIQFIALSIRDLGKSMKEGDVKGVLTTLREIIHTFTSLQIFKLFQVISKVMGSGGLLKVFRNGAKALKGLYKLWGSQAIENIANAILKLGIAIVLVAGGLAALTFLPEQNLEKLNGMLISFVVVMAVVLGMVVALTALADNATWGLLTMGFAFASITAMVVVFMIAAKKLHDYLESLFGGENGEAGLGKIMGGLLSIAAPLLSVITVLLLIFKAIGSLGKGGSALQFSLGFVGLFIAINNVVKSMEIMLTMLRTYSIGEVIAAGAILIAMFALLALCTKWMGHFKIGEESKFGAGVGAGAAMAITIAALALVIRMVLIPTLDTLIDNMDRWPDYVAALILIGASMLLMAKTIQMMNVKMSNGGFFSELANFISTMGNLMFFILMITEIKNTFIPLLEELSQVQMNENTIAGLVALGGLLLIVAVSIKIIATGVSNIIKSIALINFKALGSFVLMLGAVIAAIIGINALLDVSGIEISIESILFVVGAITGVLVIFGVFALLMTKTFAKSGKGNKMSDLGNMLAMLAILIGVVVGGLAGILAEFKLLYDGDVGKGIAVMSTFLGALAVSVGAMLLAFGKTIQLMFSNVTVINNSELKTIKGMFKILMGIIIAVMSGILIGLAEFKLLYNGSEWSSLIPVLEIVIGTIAIIVTIFKVFKKTIQALTAYNLANGSTNTSMKHLSDIFKMLLFGIATIMAVLIAGIAIIGIVYGGDDDSIWRSVLPVIEIVIAVGGIFAIICYTLAEFIKTIQNTLLTLTIGDVNLNRVTGIILSMMLGTAAMIGAVVIGIVAINESYKGENMDRIIAPALSIVLSVAASFWAISTAIGYLFKSMSLAGLKTDSEYAKLIGFIGMIGLIVAGLSVVFGIILGSLSGTSGENNIANAVAMLISVVGVFGLLVIIITSLSAEANMFMTSATIIATGIANIAKSLLFLGIAVDVLKSAFGLGQTIVEKIMNGVEDEAGIASPSKEFAKDGKYIAQGLALGIKKNTSLAVSASKAMATATNDSFCKVLKIASPSKVFYENGKFVIRGFVNGAQSEYAKNKEIGSALGEGFAESAMDGMSDEFRKLWTDEGMWEDIRKEIEESGIGDSFGESIIDSLLGGGDTTQVSQLTADEQKEISRLTNNINKYKKEIEDIRGMGAPLSGADAAGRQNRINELEKAIDSEQAKIDAIAKKSGNKTSTSFWDTISGKFGDFGNKAAEIFGVNLDEDITTRFGLGGVSYNSIKDSFTSMFSASGEEGAKSFTSSLYDFLGLDDKGENTGSKWTGVGNQIGSGIASGLGGSLLDGLESVILKNQISKTAAWLMYKTGLMDASIYAYWDPSVLDKNSDENAYAKFNAGINNWVLKDQAGLFGHSSNQPIYIELMDEDAIALANSVWSEDVGSYFSKDSLAEVQKYLAKKHPEIFGTTSEDHPYYLTYDELYEIFNMLETSGGDKTFYKKTAEAYNRKKTVSQVDTRFINDKDTFQYYFSELFGNQVEGYGIDLLQQSLKNNYGIVFDSYSELAKFCILGYQAGWLNNINGVLQIVGGSMEKVNDAAAEAAGVASPSDITKEIGSYYIEGFGVGIKDNLDTVLNTVGNATDLITDETITGLNAMADAAMNADDITPTIAPVFDDTMLQSGVSEMNTAVDSISPRVENAIGSFGFESPDYTNNINGLQNKIDGLTGVVNQFMTMIANGAGITVNVNAEADPTNIYQLVVDVNKQEFKRTGVNNLVSI